MICNCTCAFGAELVEQCIDLSSVAVLGATKTYSEFTELAESRFLDCDSCGMTQGAFDPICCGFTGYVHNNNNNNNNNINNNNNKTT